MKGSNNNRFKNILSLCIGIIASIQIFSQTITIDGNPADWPAVLGSNNISVKVFNHDAANTNADNIFTESTKDILPVAGWGWQTGVSIASIRDIENAGAALINNNLYFFGDRFGISTAGQTRTWVGVWLLLNPVAPTGTGGGPFTGSHSIGDILMLFEFAAGSVSFDLQIFEWVGEGGSNGSLNFLTTTTNGAVNGVQQPVPVFPGWTYSGNANSGFYAEQSFFEGYIDVTSLSNRCFKSFLIETRSSMADIASLFDFATGAFSGSVDGDNDGFTVCNDCNDNNAAVNPSATEVCDGIDNNCNGQVDEGLTLNIYYQDADGDGYGNPAMSVQQCSQPTGYVTNNGDCNDNPATGGAVINPGASEICDQIDNDCDGEIDEGLPTTTYYKDADGDGFGAALGSRQFCSPREGYVTTPGDCDDSNPDINPVETEVCGNDIDDNCNGTTDEGCSTIIVSINSTSVYESQGLATLSISLSNTSSQNIKVNYQTLDGTAVSKGRNKDFMSVKGSVTIPAGQLSATVSITIYNDVISEATEFFTVQISLPKNVTVATIGQSDGQVQILDGVAPSFTKTNEQTTKSNNRIETDQNGIIKFSVPNPQRKHQALKFYGITMGSFDVILFDASGKKIANLKNYRNDFSLSGLKPGLYFYHVIQKGSTHEMKRTTGKLLVTE